MQVFNVGLAPGPATLKARPDIHPGPALGHAGQARRDAVIGIALEAVRHEQIDALVRTSVQLQAGAIGMQIESVAFVQIERHQVEARAAVAIARLLDARDDAETGAAAHREHAQQRIAVGGRRGRDDDEKRQSEQRAARNTRDPAPQRAARHAWFTDKHGIALARSIPPCGHHKAIVAGIPPRLRRIAEWLTRAACFAPVMPGPDYSELQIRTWLATMLGCTQEPAPCAPARPDRRLLRGGAMDGRRPCRPEPVLDKLPGAT